jgi:DNA polymerase-3 subunit epsilon
VLSYGVLPVERGRVHLAGSLYRVVRPPIEPTAASIRVHGIRPDQLAEAPSLGDVLPELCRALEGRELVAHAATVELSFLARIRALHGRPSARDAIDVLDLADALAARDRGAPTRASARLSDLAGSYGVPVARTHHAFGDALTTAQLFVVLATRLERMGGGGRRDLARLRRSHVARTFASDAS